MMLPTFERWLAALCLFYSQPNWPTEENVQAAYRDVKHMDSQALDSIGGFIRTEYDFFPRSLSKAMHKAYAEWQKQQAEERRKADQDSKAVQWTPKTPEEAARSVARCQEIMHALRTGKRPPWAGEPRDEAGVTGPDSYQRGR
jgi:hypothetical protein